MKLVVAFTDHDDRKIAQMDEYRKRMLEANAIDDHRAYDDFKDELETDLLDWLVSTPGIAHAETLAASIIEDVYDGGEPPSYVITLYFHIIRG